MNRFFVPSKGMASWQELLASPDKHWRDGYSAKALAQAWESAKGLPPEVSRLFGADAELLLAIPEYQVELPGGTRPSQSDIFALIRSGDRTIAAAIEGKVDEPFGDKTVGEWLEGASNGKRKRLNYICSVLGLSSG